MVKISNFEVEQWMFEYENTPGVLNIAETCCDSVSVIDLVNLSANEDAHVDPIQSNKKLTYGEILGSENLRRNIAALYNDSRSTSATPLSPDNVVATQGAISANFLLYYALVGRGDHVICVYPTYQQLYSVPESLGAEVSLWQLKPENRYIPDPRELEGLVKENTKMIIINNPNNPTGATIPQSVLEDIITFAQARNIIVHSDEVYRPLFHGLGSPSDQPPSVVSLASSYPRTISTGSMSKAFSLAGIRVGWVATRDAALLRAVVSARDYATISVSQLDDQVAAYALSDAVRPALLARNMALARTNADLVEAFAKKHPDTVRWLRGDAATTAWVQFLNCAEPVDDVQLCKDVLEKTKVMLVPGSKCFGNGKDFRGFVRFGYVCDTGVLEKGLERLDQYVTNNLEP